MSLSFRKRVALVAIGNPLAGDDGVGIEICALLRERWDGCDSLAFYNLEGDLFAVTELLPTAERFLFLDAVIGDNPGDNVILRGSPRGFAGSFHQADIATVMHTLHALGTVDPFPEWEVWGVTIHPPDELRIGLSPAVRSGALTLIESLNRYLAGHLRAGTDAITRFTASSR